MTDDSWKQNQQRCIHFNGTINKTCDAGVDYSTVVDETKQPYGYPCLKNQMAGSCDHQQFLTDEEAKQKEKDDAQVISNYFADIAANICPICRRPINIKRQIGRCVYAYPCGDRLYQGTLKPGG